MATLNWNTVHRLVESLNEITKLQVENGICTVLHYDTSSSIGIYSYFVCVPEAQGTVTMRIFQVQTQLRTYAGQRTLATRIVMH